jgi:hypothetical protein
MGPINDKARLVCTSRAGRPTALRIPVRPRRIVCRNRQRHHKVLGSKASMGEIDHLIIELQTLRRKLQTDGERIERDITVWLQVRVLSACDGGS